MNQPVNEELLILTKTYPSPSSKYRETTCVAAINRQGEMRRLVPVPFRLLEGGAKFKKWEWIRARVSRTTGDQRPESRRIDADSIFRSGKIIEITRSGDWGERLVWLEPQVVPSFSALEARRQSTGETLGFIRPSRILELKITAVKDADWTEADRQKLTQDGLFDAPEVKARPQVRKLPFDFHYRSECASPNGIGEHTHKLTDWEAGALFWKCFCDHGPKGWEAEFRQWFETEFATKDLLFLLGTIHRFPDQWLIVGIVYPPKSVF